VALPDPERNTVRDYHEETQKELENHIKMFLMELVADLDEDNALQHSDAAMSLNEFRKATVETTVATKASPRTWWT